ncbi:ATPase, T2SS/T4P/T4SS family [Thermodesulfobacteriota bacterium]
MKRQKKGQKSPIQHQKLGDYLIKVGLIDATTLENALEIQKIQKKQIGQILIDMQVVDDVEISRAIAKYLRMPFVRLTDKKIPQNIIDMVRQETVEKYLLIPVSKAKDKLVVAMTDPLEPDAINDLRFITQMPIHAVVSPRADILDAIGKYYPKPDLADDLNFELNEAEDMIIVEQKDEDEADEQDLLNLADLPPVVRFTNAIVADAIKRRASDIHIEPQASTLLVRYRIDGIMRESVKTKMLIHASLVSRLKVISGLDIAVSRKPQDGKAQVNYDGLNYDLRVSTIPTSEGEKATIRILNPATAKLLPSDLGFSEKNLKKISEIVGMTQGIVLVTGPTGSGKSTTLYACLNRLNTSSVNIITVEDPVEFEIEGINQVQINPKAGLSFAAGIRAILRQDPDVIMVGEIRDSETALIGTQAAQTGHLVLSTLHTNDAISAVTRLFDLGLKSYQISSAVIAVIGQRLVRRIHQDCKVQNSPRPEILNRFIQLAGEKRVAALSMGRGCEACQNTGYRGRMGLYEVLMMTPALKELIEPEFSVASFKKTAEREGFQTMLEDGVQKAIQGRTTIQEVFRVVPLDAEHDIKSMTSESDAPLSAAVVSNGREERGPEQSIVEQSSERLDEKRSLQTVRLPQIMVVDDNNVTLKILEKILSKKNYAVITAENGTDALNLALKEQPDLVITDYNMPRLDGIALIRELKSRRLTRSIPIIMLTTEDAIDSEVEVFNAGADDYLIKPVHSKRLVARVSRFLANPDKILIVDDSKDFLDLMRQKLLSENYLVLTAESGTEAIKIVEQEKPDIVVTDYYMPQMDGIELVRELKARTRTRKTPIIMLTGDEAVDTEVEAIDAGADDYLTKPVNPKRLVARIKRLLRISSKP